MASPSRSSTRRLLRAALLGATLAAMAQVVPASARGGSTEVDVELVLAVDISYSMDTEEQRLQRNGYVEALRSEQFLNALKQGSTGRIAVVYMQWASEYDTDTLLEWTVIDGPDSASAFAAKLAAAPYRRAQRTSISGAIDAAAKLFEGNGFDSARQVIDVSGDGPNNSGRPVAQARDEALAQGITINGLPLVGIRAYRSPADIEELDTYYQDCVIGGFDAFMVPIRDSRSFVEATRTKLVREIAANPGPPTGATITRVAAKEPRISCMIGESLWRNRWGN
ncbi:MAG: DUF1194 domain-containing protein [Beijerinckiaceae bacterium]|nr:DUF1194 domain-containing protein [Beijerinckiaceae bacterium]